MPELAAQYLRMSTDSQLYSLVNQAEAIAHFAAAQGFEIIATYEDAGKSGLSVRNRAGLQRLISDVVNGSAVFKTVLVLDVSRWGRFQDPDQAGHYEFLCREAGVAVRYCAEGFDPGSSGAVMKQLKRVMAGEYSRDLSQKVRVGQRRQARLGFTIGGPAPYGFARQVVRANGSVGAILQPGERRSRVEDNVRYALGPVEEVENIRRIFSLYVRGHLTPAMIAARLNAAGACWRGGSPWSRHRVVHVLRCELVIGAYVFGKQTSELGKITRNPRSEWHRREMVPPIVSSAVFSSAARASFERQGRRLSDARLLKPLRRLLKEKNRLSASLISACPDAAAVSTYRERFGSLEGAYARVGYVSAAKRILRDPMGRPVSQGAILERLATLRLREGRLSARLISADPGLPSLSYIKRHFGSLTAAYALSAVHRPAPS